MSSDCFDVRVQSVDGAEVILDVLTGTAGGLDDLCASRSFALVAMHGALQGAVDTVRYTLSEDKSAAEIQRLYAKHDDAALVKALADEGDWYVEPEWMKKNVGRFIASCALVERRNNVGEDELSRRAAAIEAEFGGALYTNQAHLWQPRRWALCHNYTLRVIVADPKWAAHLEPGLEWGTTAYDVWFERASSGG